MEQARQHDEHDEGLGPASVPRRPYAVGMPVEPAEWTPPAVRAEVEPWRTYHGVRFSGRTRLIITVALLTPVLALVLLSLRQFVQIGGPRGAWGIVFLFPVVIAAPLVWWAVRDLWGPHR